MVSPRNINDILLKLPGAHQSGENWTASCLLPGHKTPAGHLTLRDAGDKALVTCQGGRHTYQDYCQAWGFANLKYSRNGSGPEKNKQKTLVTTLSYECEKGKEAYQIRRFDLGNGSKTFEVWHKKDDKYVSGMGKYKGKPILYHFPEISEWIIAGKTIYLPEGELKADRIISKGGAATTSPFGAGRNKWRTEYSKALAGAKVIILPDNDKPGHDFAQDKAVSLYGIAKNVKVLELLGLPEKGDIVDWFSAGGTFEKLERLAIETTQWKPISGVAQTGFCLTKLSDLFQEPVEEITYIWDKTLIRGGLSIMAAKPKVGKSTLVRNLAVAVAKGEPLFLGRAITTCGPVVYFALEEKRIEVRKHFERMGANNDLPIFVHTGSAPEKAIEELRKAVIESKSVMAIVDPLQRLVRSPDLNDYSSVSLALEPLMQIARDTGCHILLIHHANKAIARESGDSILGSTAIFGSVDCALIMKRSESYRTIESIQRYGEDLPRTVLTFDIVTGLTSSGGSLEDVEIAECGTAIMELLTDHEITEKEIKDGITDHKGGTVSKSLRLLFQECKIQRQGLGKKGNPYLYATVTRNTGDTGDKYIEIPTIPTIPINQAEGEVIDKDSEINHPQSMEIEAVLGLPAEKAIEIWHKEGAPAIYLRPGENCSDLEKLLSNPHTSECHFQAVGAWLQQHKGSNGQ